MYRLGEVLVGKDCLDCPSNYYQRAFPFSCALFVKLFVVGSESIFVLESGLGIVGKK